MGRLCSVALGILWLSLGTYAANHRSVPDGYTRRVWQTQDGLPENTVQAFAQTPDHYLWIGTSGGLVRFDGASFVVYDRDNTPAIRDNSIFCLTAARDGSLWAGTDGAGLVRYQERRLPFLPRRRRADQRFRPRGISKPAMAFCGWAPTMVCSAWMASAWFAWMARAKFQRWRSTPSARTAPATFGWAAPS